MPEYAILPPDVTYSVALEPAYNALNSLILIVRLDAFSGLDDWVVRTAAALTPAQRHTHKLVLVGLHYATIPERSWPSFPAYLADLAAQPPEILRDRMLDSYLEICGWKESSRPVPTREELIGSLEFYLHFLESNFPGADFDSAIETAAYHLVMDPPAMQDVIVAHLRLMWDEFLAEEWRRVEPLLQESVDAFRPIDLTGLEPMEAHRRVFGHDLKDEKWAGWLNMFERFVFVPSAHIGPYKGHFASGKTAYEIFGARLPEGVTRPASSALSRSELLVRLNALADDTRLQILALLAQEGELCAQDIIVRLDMSQSAVSRHLGQLSATGYLVERRVENAKCYRFNPARLDDTCDALKKFLG